MLRWIKENFVVSDKLKDLFGAGCFTVARYLLAAIVLLVAAVVACGCASGGKAAAYPERSDVHAALFASVWGLKVLNSQCFTAAMALSRTGDQEKASWLAQSCDDRLVAAQAELEPALEEISIYRPDSYVRIGCHLKDTMLAYKDLRLAMESRGLYDADIADGQTQTEKLVKLATVGGDCGK
jgi:hypothetical protein